MSEDCDFVDQGAIDDLINASIELEPYLDQLICYASTADEHKPNRIVSNFVSALKTVLGEKP